MVLPAFGIISEVVPVFSRKPIFGYSFMVGSGIAIAFFSFTVWAHHMFAVGLGTARRTRSSAPVSMMIAVPDRHQDLHLAGDAVGRAHPLHQRRCCSRSASSRCSPSAASAASTSPSCRSTGRLTDTYYVVAHFHYVLFGGTLLAIFGRHLLLVSEDHRPAARRAARQVALLADVVGFNLTFFPMHIVGLMGMPRRVYTYPDLPGWGALNFVETVGAFIHGRGGAGAGSGTSGAACGTARWPATTRGTPGRWSGPRPRRRPPTTSRAAAADYAAPRPLWDLKLPGTAVAARRGASAPPAAAAAAGVDRGAGFFGSGRPVLGTLRLHHRPRSSSSRR